MSWGLHGELFITANNYQQLTKLSVKVVNFGHLQLPLSQE